MPPRRVVLSPSKSSAVARRPKGPVTRAPFRLTELERASRADAIPLLKESFEGYYRWHSKRTLREVEHVRVARRGPTIVGVSMFERLRPEVGYINYAAVVRASRHAGVGSRLLEDALRQLRRDGVEVVFAAAERTNRASIALLTSHGFRRTRRKETPWREGGLGAWGLRSQMHIVAGEVVLALRVRKARGPTRGEAGASRAERAQPCCSPPCARRRQAWANGGS